MAQGSGIRVDLFLRWGANPNTVDESGLAPLHWALVKGSLPCVQKLVEYGADRFARTQDGKTPAIVASDMNTVRVWYRALDECGYDFDGNTKVLPMGMASWARNKSIMSKFFFLWPFLARLLGAWGGYMRVTFPHSMSLIFYFWFLGG